MDKLFFEDKGAYLLKQIGISKAEFARKMGVQRQNVDALFKSKNIDTIRRAADVLGVPFEMLIGYSTEMEIPLLSVSPDEGGMVSGGLQSLDIVIIEKSIHEVRGLQIILDRDLAMMYQEDVGQMNRQVKRNIKRFPSDFMFQLTREEYDSLKCQNGISNTRGGDRALPYAFTEQGVAMLSGLLRSDIAIQVNIMVMRAFVAMRRFLSSNAQVFQRLDHLEQKQQETEVKIEQLFGKFEQKSVTPAQGIFYDGQIYDAYSFVSKLIREAETRIVLIDNYVNDEVITMLDKRGPGVEATIYAKQLTRQLLLDLKRHNEQYASIEVRPFGKSHDRFLIIDNDVYHIGASLKDLGRKWFAFSRMVDIRPEELLSKC